jgi:ABC-type nitrate/sulfonate/bicarbonate transport system substrate-binding protein
MRESFRRFAAHASARHGVAITPRVRRPARRVDLEITIQWLAITVLTAAIVGTVSGMLARIGG